MSLDAPVATGTEIVADDKSVGEVLSVAGKQAIAYLRFDKAHGEMLAGTARVTRS